MMAKALPIEGDNFRAKVESNLAEIKKLPKTSKVALKSAYIFSQKVPKEDREDLFQDIALEVLKAKTSEERLGYAIARCDWQDFWKKRHIRLEKVCLLEGLPKAQNHGACTFSHKPSKCTDCGFRAYRQMKSLESVVEDDQGNPVRLAELVIGESEFEIKMNGKLDAERIFSILPKNLKKVVINRLLGNMVSPFDSLELQQWANKHSMYLT